MPIDPYSPCPGGTGKKVKFCCSDLVQELDKVQRLLEGEQPTACLDHIRILDEKYPGRACLQSIRVNLESAVGDHAAAEKTVASFLETHPSNPVALAQKALQAAYDDVLTGIPWLQKALEAGGQEIPVQVYDAIGILGLSLLASEHYLPARAHLQLQVGVSQAKDERAVNALLHFESSPRVPVLIKDSQPLVAAPEGVPWKVEFDQALGAAQRGHWQRAAEGWTSLAGKVADSADLWRNLATMRGYLADYHGAADALRKYAALNVPPDDAVEAEALAQLLTKEDAHGQVDELTLTFPITNAEAAQEKMAADRRFERISLDPSAWKEDNEPPPRAAFALLDRPLPTTGDGIQRDQVPHHLAQMLLFGKQTDREARLELTLYRPELDAVRKILREVLGDLLGMPGEEDVFSHLSQVEHALSWHWRIPDETPDEARQSLAAEQRRAMVLERWPTIPQPMLGGRTAEQAAGEPQYRLKLLAAIWLLQLSDTAGSAETMNELRRKLGLPEQAEIDATGLDANRVPLARFARVKVETLTDEQLQQAFNRAAITGFALALRRLAPEVVRRPELPVAQYKLPAYRLLARMTRDSNEALRLIDEARKLAEANKQSSASWDLLELTARIQRGEGPVVTRLIDHLRKQHAREPGVIQALAQVLVQSGLVTPDGRLAGRLAPESSPEAASIVSGGETEPGKLWTPDAPQPAGEKKSALWIPD